MRALAFALAVIIPTAANAVEVPQYLTGLWAEDRSDCDAGPGDNFNTFISKNHIAQYETECSLSNMKKDGDSVAADMSCKFVNTPSRGTVRILRARDGKLIVDMRTQYYQGGHLTLALVFCSLKPKG